MQVLLAVLVLAQDVLPPVDVPASKDLRESERTTLFDGFDAYERLVDAFASADGAAQRDPKLHARADGALDAWQRGERRVAVEAWTRLALELRGSTADDDLLAAVLRLECVEGGDVTRIRRGFYSAGMGGRATKVRVRALFTVEEFASRSFGDDIGRICYQNLLLGDDDPLGERGARFPVVFDATGDLTPVILDVDVLPMGFWECALLSKVNGRTIDEVIIENGQRTSAERTAHWLKQANATPIPGIDVTTAASLGYARRAFRSRVALLRDVASLERSAEFLVRVRADRRCKPLPRWQRSDELDLVTTLMFNESERLKARRSPYSGWTEPTTARGPFWRTHAHGERDVPAWTLIPEAGRDGALAVIVVLHEVGFDEGWAVRLAGRGALFEEADRRGVAVLAPPNAELEADPAAFTALIDSLALDIGIDRARVHVLAPASAAPLARRLAESFPTLVASVIVLGEVDAQKGAPIQDAGRVLGLEKAIARALDGLQRTERK